MSDFECHKHIKNDEYLDIKNYLCGKRLFDKLPLTYEDEILNTAETSLDNKTAMHENNCLIHTISCCFYWLLLLSQKIMEKARTFITI